MSQPQSAAVKLAAGPLTLVLAPTCGGGIAEFSADGVHILRPATDEAWAAGSPRAMGSFAMVPFSGRVAEATFPWEGGPVQLKPNFPPERHAIHGDGWQAAWSVVTASASVAQLAFDHTGTTPGWPWSYRCEQTFALDPDCLTMTVAIENRGDTPMPVGFGFHPYFLRTPAVRLRAAVPEVWVWDTAKRPAAKIATPKPWALDPERPVAGLALDHCFAGWDGVAEITWPEHRLAVTIEAGAKLRHLIVFTPDTDVFCVEPATHAPDALNIEPDTVPLLAPGKSISGGCRLRVRRW